MYKPYLFLLPVALMFAILAGCGNLGQVEQPATNGQGIALLKIAAAAGPFQKLAKKATLTISASDMLTMTKSLTITDSSVEGTITGIPAGKSRVFSVSVFDSLDTLQYQGSATANVIADSTVKVSISVTRLVGNATINGSVIEADSLLKIGLIAYYPFNNNANDNSEFGNNGNISGATFTTDRFGNANSALSFNGSSDYLSIPDKSVFHLTSGISISIWLLPNAGDQAVMQKGAGVIGSQSQDGDGWEIFINPTSNSAIGWMFNLFDADSMFSYPDKPCHRVATPITSSITTWQHFVGSFDGSAMRLYLNGVLSSTTLGSFTIATNTDSIQFGRDYWARTGQTQRYGGKMDDIRIYSRALSASEVLALYHEGGWVGN